MLSSTMFQGVGKGFNALLLTFLRALVFMSIFSILFAIVFDKGIVGLWYGFVVGNIIGATIAFLWASHFIKKLQRSNVVVS